MSKLKDCPFCGGEANTSIRWNNDIKTWTGLVMCNHCQASGSICGGEDTEAEARQTAIENWNNAYRPNPHYMAMVRKWNNFWRWVRREN